MGRLLSGHPLSGAILLIALVLAMTAEQIAGAPANANRRASTDDVSDDIGRFSRAVVVDVPTRAVGPSAASDPFSGDAPQPEPGVEQASTPIAQPAARLTAVLIADDGSVAVIDDEAVSVGATLKTGERVARILEDRVWIVKPNGQWRALTLPGRVR
jgi:hypothetical protein